MLTLTVCKQHALWIAESNIARGSPSAACASGSCSVGKQRSMGAHLNSLGKSLFYKRALAIVNCRRDTRIPAITYLKPKQVERLHRCSEEGIGKNVLAVPATGYGKSLFLSWYLYTASSWFRWKTPLSRFWCLLWMPLLMNNWKCSVTKPRGVNSTCC